MASRGDTNSPFNTLEKAKEMIDMKLSPLLRAYEFVKNRSDSEKTMMCQIFCPICHEYGSKECIWGTLNPAHVHSHTGSIECGDCSFVIHRCCLARWAVKHPNKCPICDAHLQLT